MALNTHCKVLVLDATPLIVQPYSNYQNYAESFYTTPTVFNEIRDENARKNIESWKGLGGLDIRHPNEKSIKRVSDFARLTGDYSVLSANDIHILALTYELEVELNKGDWRLRKKPAGISVKQGRCKKTISGNEKTCIDDMVTKSCTRKDKKKRRGGKKQRAKKEAQMATQATDNKGVPHTSESVVSKETGFKEVQPGSQKYGIGQLDNEKVEPASDEQYKSDDDDGEWISPENIIKTVIKDSGEDLTGCEQIEAAEYSEKNQVALVTGDFAVQNVALQLGLNLMNFMSGMRIKRLRNYMLRCHACFKMFPIPKDGKTQHFCPSCGGNSTLLRCAVSVDSETGEVTPHLKANFQWINRGNHYSIASPLSKASQKRYGKKGFDHAKPPQDVPLLCSDQKEYLQLIKQEEWTRRHNEKVLTNWVGGGSADNCISPFFVTGLKHISVRVNRGRYVNSSGKKKK